MPRKKRCRRVCEEPDFPVFRPAGRVSGGHVLATVDDEIAARIHAELAANGIKLFTGADTRRLVSKTSTRLALTGDKKVI